MSMDFSGRESDKPLTDQDESLFAAQPIWERNRKRKGFGGRKTASAAPAAPAAATVAPEPRTFAAERDYEEPMALDRPINRPSMDRPAMDRPMASSPMDRPLMSTNSTLARDQDAGLVTPIAHASTKRPAKSSSIAPAAIAAAVVGLGALGAAGWYMSREPEGVPELAAGSTTSEVAAAPLTPVEPPAQVAVNEALAPPVAPTPAATPSTPPPRAEAARAPTRTTARARPAPRAPSAASASVNASTTAVLPDGPQPYATSPGTTAPTQVNPPLVTLPPSSEAPAAVPATPPTLPQEPATEAPKPDTAVTPPQ